MTTLHFPWIELAIFLPLLAAPFIARTRDPEIARRQTSVVALLTLLLATMVWLDFSTLNTFEADDNWSPIAAILGDHFLAVDELSAPLLPLTALLYALTIFATPRTKVGRFSFGWSILSESIRMAVLSCKDPWGIIFLMAAGMIPLFMELRSRGRSTRIFVIHMGTCVALMVVGWGLVEWSGMENPSLLGGGITDGGGLASQRGGAASLLDDRLIRERQLWQFAFVRYPDGRRVRRRPACPSDCPDWALHGIAIISLFTAVYAAGMAIVQTEARRLFCYLFLSHSSLVFVGLETVTPIGLTGALQVWLSVGLALGGFGLTLRSIEARTGRLSLVKYNGLFEHIPAQAAFFLLTGLASVGFPGTIGFVASELLIEGRSASILRLVWPSFWRPPSMASPSFAPTSTFSPALGTTRRSPFMSDSEKNSPSFPSHFLSLEVAWFLSRASLPVSCRRRTHQDQTCSHDTSQAIPRARDPFSTIDRGDGDRVHRQESVR